MTGPLQPANTEGAALRERMRAGERLLGMFLTSTDPSTSTIMGLAGADFVVIDAEHGPLDRLHALQHVRAAEAGGCVPIVRVLEGSPTVIQSFLEVGARGIIVPHVETAQQAARMVAATRYAPAGTRGACNICFTGGYGLSDWPTVCRHADRSVLAIPLIESASGVANIDEIVAVDGVDVVFFGPGDLAQDLGEPQMGRFDSPRLLEAWQAVAAAARRTGTEIVVPIGFEAGLGEAHGITVGGDLSLLAKSASERIDRVRKELT